MRRRTFLELAGLGLGSSFLSSKLAAGSESRTPPVSTIESQGAAANAYGSGHFGEWVSDPFGMPAYLYTCNQITNPKALSPVEKAWRFPTDHTHQVGNDRLIAAVSNYGYVQVRQDEGSPKFLNDYAPERGQFGAGIGYLTDGNAVLSTFYSGQAQPGQAEPFDRVFGVGYMQKKVGG